VSAGGAHQVFVAQGSLVRHKIKLFLWRTLPGAPQKKFLWRIFSGAPQN
jgi:hypothetical protein